MSNIKPQTDCATARVMKSFKSFPSQPRYSNLTFTHLVLVLYMSSAFFKVVKFTSRCSTRFLNTYVTMYQFLVTTRHQTYTGTLLASMSKFELSTKLRRARCHLHFYFSYWLATRNEYMLALPQMRANWSIRPVIVVSVSCCSASWALRHIIASSCATSLAISASKLVRCVSRPYEVNLNGSRALKEAFMSHHSTLSTWQSGGLIQLQLPKDQRSGARSFK
ncbi:hypothetical protein EDD15DRAFT_2311944 [Pisolithus albus]|nr:hypothetical protein EDD15DRAFT_2311944 [Pisolithus albus]